MKLNEEQVKALTALVSYVAVDECENAGGRFQKEGHIWNDIRVLYELVFGIEDLVELEDSFREEESNVR